MNYNIIYNDDTGEYYDINSKEGGELVEYYSSFVLKKKKKNYSNKRKIKKILNKEYMYTHTFNLQITSLGSIKTKLIRKDIFEDVESVFLYLLSLFIQDSHYTKISFYNFIYIVYTFINHYHKHYKEVTVHLQEHQIDKTNDNDINDNDIIDNRSSICLFYNKKYKLSDSTIKQLIMADHTNILDLIVRLCHTDTYTTILHTHISNNFIEKKVIH